MSAVTSFLTQTTAPSLGEDGNEFAIDAIKIKKKGAQQLASYMCS